MVPGVIQHLNASVSCVIMREEREREREREREEGGTESGTEEGEQKGVKVHGIAEAGYGRRKRREILITASTTKLAHPLPPPLQR